MTFYTSDNPELLASFQKRASEADGQPYRQWRTPDNDVYQVCLIREDNGVLAICPEQHLVVEGTDYLETTFELSRRLMDRVGLPQGTKLSEMVLPPFIMTWGKKGTTFIEANREAPEQDEDPLPMEAAEHTPAETEDAMNMDPDDETTDEPQIDLFSL